MEQKCESTEEVDQKLLFYNLGSYFQNVYGNNPMELVRLTKKVLSMEQMLIQQSIQQQPTGSHTSNQQAIAGSRMQEINKSLENISKNMAELDQFVQKLCRQHEYRMISRSNLDMFQKMSDNNQMSKEQHSQWKLEAKKHTEYESEVVNVRGQIATKYESIIQELQEVHNTVTVIEMRSYDRSQACSYNVS